MIKVVFMGTPDFSVPVLRRLIEDGYDVIGVVTQPDRPVGRKSINTYTCQSGSRKAWYPGLTAVKNS